MDFLANAIILGRYKRFKWWNGKHCWKIWRRMRSNYSFMVIRAIWEIPAGTDQVRFSSCTGYNFKWLVDYSLFTIRLTAFRMSTQEEVWTFRQKNTKGKFNIMSPGRDTLACMPFSLTVRYLVYFLFLHSCWLGQDGVLIRKVKWTLLDAVEQRQSIYFTFEIYLLIYNWVLISKVKWTPFDMVGRQIKGERERGGAREGRRRRRRLVPASWVWWRWCCWCWCWRWGWCWGGGSLDKRWTRRRTSPDLRLSLAPWHTESANRATSSFSWE